MTPAIEARDLGRTYGEREALSGVTMTVAPGTVVGLLGPNGGGKTTLFRILATLLPPSEGRARILGLDVVRDAGAVRGRIGVVFQEPALDRQLTVWENLRHQGHLQGLWGRRLRTRIEELLESLGLSDRRDERVSRLSGGLARRADLARGLIHRPEVLILDEPTAGLDPISRRDFGDRLRSLRDADRVTILLTTHLTEEAGTCDRVGILDDGRLVALDTPESLRDSVGGEVLSARVEDPETFRTAILERFGLESRVLGDTVRMECEDGQRAMRDLLAAFHDRILSITLSRPTLEDAFILRTGHRLHDPGDP